MRTAIISTLLCWMCLFAADCVADQTGLIPDIRDVAKEHGFTDIGDLVHEDLLSDGTQIFLCVKTRDSQYALWNPISDVVSKPNARNCDVPSSLKPLYATVGYDPIYAPQQFVSKDSGFINKLRIYTDDEPHLNCSPNINTYFRVKLNDKSYKKFYIIIRLKNPERVSLGIYCESSQGLEQHIVQDYDNIRGLTSIDLGNSRALWYSLDKRSIRPFILIVSDVPKRSIAIDNDFFLVPVDDLKPKLERAGPTLVKRYDVLLSVLKQ